MKPNTPTKTFRSCLLAVLVAAWLAGATAAHAQAGSGGGPSFIVDCPGAIPTPNSFPSINAFLRALGPFDYTVVVDGTCHENIVISNGDNFHLVAANKYATISGNINIVDSSSGVYLKGLTVSNPNGDGIDVSKSKVILDSCNVSGDAGNGISISNSSDVEITAGSFNDNGANGFNVGSHSLLSFGSGPVETRRNKQSGLRVAQADFFTAGNTQISDGVNGPGVELLGGAHAQFGNFAGPNIIENNPTGGISVRENSELSMWTCCSQPESVVRGNGKFGIAAGFHSQVTLSGAEVSHNIGPGVDVYANSQLDFFPGTENQIRNNGTLGDPVSAGLRVDGNSEAWLRGGDISLNTGPGILVLVNSSVDFSGVNFLLNTAGVIRCDLSSLMTSDLPLGQGVACIPAGHAPVTR